MAKSASTAVLDGALDVVATGTILNVCSAQPTTYLEATSTYSLADVALTGASFTKAAGDVSGRKVTVAQQSAIPIDTTGTATHIAISTVTGSLLRIVTTCTSQALTAGGTVTVPAFDFEVSNPS